MWRRSGWLRQPSALSRTSQHIVFNPFNQTWNIKRHAFTGQTRRKHASTLAWFPELLPRPRRLSTTKVSAAYFLLPAACLILVCGNGQAALDASLSRPAGNGTDLCHDSRYQSGGPAIPAYNYADSGDDWPGTCQSGKQQSPIDFPDRSSVTLRRLPSDKLVQFGSVTASGNAVVRLEVQEVALFSSLWSATGFHVPVCGTAGGVDIGCLESPTSSSVHYADVSVMNLHFHANTEHTHTGSYYGAEAHLVTNVTVNGSSHLVVFGVWMDVGDTANDFFSQLQPFIDQSIGAGCNPVPNDIQFSVDSLFPADKEYYAYRGSLTTPPCSEDVTWIVFTHPVKMSVAQLKSLYRANANTFQPCDTPTTSKLCNILGARTNNRVLQPLNGRTISIGSTPSV
ncbi:probable carbonic anhydrase [Coccomyxa sp. Obi]|nr:probable carbonic anhydrase [Coccomyxa sp. Obi]